MLETITDILSIIGAILLISFIVGVTIARFIGAGK